MMEGKKTMLNSNWQTFFLLVKGNIGPGCLALPYSFSMLGSHGSLPFLIIVAVLCIGNMWLLVECKRKVPTLKTYGELGLQAFGRRGEVTIEVFLTISQLSICCVYITFISNGIAPLLGLSNRFVTVLLSLPISILSQYRHMRDLAPLSIIASVLLVCALSIIGFVCMKKLSLHGEPENMPAFESSKIILFLVSTVYAFEGIGIILPIEGSMQHPKYFSQILAVSMTIVTMVYISFGEIVIMAFGSIQDAGITKYLVTVGSVPVSLAATISVLVSSAVLLSYPLQLYPALQVLEIYFNLDVADDSPSSSHSLCEERGERGVSATSAGTGAGFVDGASTAVSISPPPAGTTTAYPNGCIQKYICPFFNKMWNTLVFFNVLKNTAYTATGTGVMYDSPEFKRKRKPTRIFSYQENQSISCQGVGTTSYIIPGHTDADDSPTRTDDIVHRSHSLSEIEMNRYRAISNDSDKTEECDLDLDFEEEAEEAHGLIGMPSTPTRLDPSDISFIRTFLRLFLVFCTVLVAAFIPNIGLLVSLAGATSGTSLALIFPPVLEVLITRQQRITCSSNSIGMSLPRLLFCVVSISVGIIGAILGTVISLSDIYFAMHE